MREVIFHPNEHPFDLGAFSTNPQATLCQARKNKTATSPIRTAVNRTAPMTSLALRSIPDLLGDQLLNGQPEPYRIATIVLPPNGVTVARIWQAGWTLTPVNSKLPSSRGPATPVTIQPEA